MKDGCDDHVTCVSAGVRVSCGRSRIKATEGASTFEAGADPALEATGMSSTPFVSHRQRSTHCSVSSRPVRGCILLAPGRPLSTHGLLELGNGDKRWPVGDVSKPSGSTGLNSEI